MDKFWGHWWLVFGIVCFSEAAYIGYTAVLFGRDGGKAWDLLKWIGFFAALKVGGWLALLFERPEFYNTVPMFGWVILFGQAVQAALMFALAFKMVKRRES